MMDMMNVAAPILKASNTIGLSYALMASYMAGLNHILSKNMDKKYYKSFCGIITSITIPLIMFRDFKLNDNMSLLKSSTLLYYFLLAFSIFTACFIAHGYIEKFFDMSKGTINIVFTFMTVFILSYLILKYVRSGVVKIGVLHALTGKNNVVEQPVVDLLDVLANDINNEGGINGKKIVLVKYDTKSDINEYKKGAQYFMDQNIKTVFGGWSSISRKEIKPIFEKHNGLLIYPTQSEGQECSPNIIYSGCVPNQHIETGVRWAAGNLGIDFFLLGSDSVYSRTCNQVMKGLISEIGGKIVGEEYFPPDTESKEDIERVVNKITQNKKCIILNTCRTLSLPLYFKTLYEKYRTMDENNTQMSGIYPNMCFTLSDKELKLIDNKYLIGHFATAGYFQTIMTYPNMMFILKVMGHMGTNTVTTDAMSATMQAFNIWALAVSKVGDEKDIDSVKSKMYERPIRTPSGMAILTKNNHISQHVYIGKVNQKRQFDIVFNTIGPVEPRPWSNYIPETAGYDCNVAAGGQGPKFKGGPLQLRTI